MVGIHPRSKFLTAGAFVTALTFRSAGAAGATVSQIPLPPTDIPTPHGPVLAYALFNWFFTAVVIILLVREAWRTRSAFPLAFLVAGTLSSIVEPVFDGNIHVWFAQLHDTAAYRFYNVSYPWYEMPGNALLGGPMYLMYYLFKRGVSSRALWGFFFLWWGTDSFQELPGTTMAAYGYFGPHPFVISGFPVWVGMLAGLGFPLAGYAAYGLSKVLSGVRLWLMTVILLPVVEYGCEVIAWPMWITLNGGADLHVTRWMALLSLVFTLCAYYFLTLSYARERAMTSSRVNMSVANAA